MPRHEDEPSATDPRPEFPTTLGGFYALQRSSLADRESYWRGEAARLSWDAPFSDVVQENLAEARSAWFVHGRLDAAANIFASARRGGWEQAPALAYFAEDGSSRTLRYAELEAEVDALAAALGARALAPGERVALFLPDGPEAVIAALACVRLGLTYVPLATSQSQEMVERVLQNCEPALVFVATTGRPAYQATVSVVVAAVGAARVVAAGETGAGPLAGVTGWTELLAQGRTLPAPPRLAVDAEQPLFVLYAGAGTGIPRGGVFATGGYLVQARTSHRDLFLGGHEPAGPGAPVCCSLPLASTAGQTYGLWGPLLLGCCLVRHALGEDDLGQAELEAMSAAHPRLRLLATPHLLAHLRQKMGPATLPAERKLGLVASCWDSLAPRLVAFAGTALTDGQERVLNLWIQNSGGVALIATYPQLELNRTGAMGLAAPGVDPQVLNDFGQPCRANESGQLVFGGSWPAMVRSLWRQPDRYRELFFSRVPGRFATNDGARLDREGFFWFMGRLDDVVKVDGWSISTSEVESVLAAHPKVAEAAVVGVVGESEAQGAALVAFLVLRAGAPTEEEQELARRLAVELGEHVQQRLGEFAPPGRFFFVRELPRTRSGKVVRRVLRRIATGDVSPDEDWSHVANPGALEDLVRRSGR